MKKIIIFGSWTRDQTDFYSNVDLIIILNRVVENDIPAKTGIQNILKLLDSRLSARG